MLRLLTFMKFKGDCFKHHYDAQFFENTLNTVISKI